MLGACTLWFEVRLASVRICDSCKTVLISVCSFMVVEGITTMTYNAIDICDSVIHMTTRHLTYAAKVLLKEGAIYIINKTMHVFWSGDVNAIIDRTPVTNQRQFFCPASHRICD